MLMVLFLVKPVLMYLKLESTLNSELVTLAKVGPWENDFKVNLDRKLIRKIFELFTLSTKNSAYKPGFTRQCFTPGSTVLLTLGFPAGFQTNLD
ncbi:hypothetical protein TNIN_481781 [Trichonephila inaurata madagascariensis]|uniref:Uncharacterized protein n=1 Tax=Trichonephila inaurata madagascariensis TaxID=2747483 RepID=A0A8X6X135_9ARAC|nr:hypothetical protein TNIN_481781 [Trichonephila inaurata madagascariensis]